MIAIRCSCGLYMEPSGPSGDPTEQGWNCLGCSNFVFVKEVEI